MGIKEAYESVEEKYYGFMDWLQDKKIPVYKVIDAFEERGVPTFPLFILFILIIAALVYGAFAGGFGFIMPLNSGVTISVQGPDGVGLSGAQVFFSYAGTEKSVKTDATGDAKFSVPYNSQVSIIVKLSGYEDKTDTFTADKLDYKLPVTLNALAKTIKKTIQFVDNSSGSLIKKELALSFSCTENSDFKESKTTSTGTVDIEVPADCGTILVAATNGYEVQGNGTIDLSAPAPQILLSAPQTETGSVLVTITGADGNALDGIQVTIVSDEGQRFGPKLTSQDGTFLFDSVQIGKYWVIAYDSVYGTVDTSVQDNGKKSVDMGQRTEFAIEMQKQLAEKIKVLVKDKLTGSGIQGASVTLFKDGAKQIATQKTDSTGRTEFSVSENVNTYSVQVDSLQYLKATLPGISPSATEYTMLLVQATASNANTLLVSVIDESGLPVEDTIIKVKKVSDGTQVAEATTDLDGKARFERLEEGSYEVQAQKPGYGNAQSKIISVNSRQDNSVELQLVIGFGTIEVTALDSDGSPLNGATAVAVDQFSGNKLGNESATGTDGKTQLNVRADKTALVQVRAKDYADYFTLPMQMTGGATKSVEVQMEQAPSEVSAQFSGYFSGSEQAGDSLSQGQKYGAKFKVYVPSNEAYNEAGIHFRLGTDDSDSVDKEYWYVKGASMGNAVLRKGASYNRPSGYSTDLGHLTTGNAKWAELTVKNPKAGIHEATFEVQVRSGVQLGTGLESHYRAWAKTGGNYTRYPLDSVLGESDSVSGKQALYAYTNTDILSIGPNNLCGADFCYTFIMEDTGTGVQTSVLDEYSASIGGHYKLYYSITSRASQSFDSAKLRFLGQTSAVSMTNYSSTVVGGQKSSGNIQANSLEINAGKISAKDNVSGTIEFDASKEGASGIAISIVSGKTVFQKTILVKVESQSPLLVTVIPKMIIPFVQNDLLIIVTDDRNNAVSGATVTITKNNLVVSSGTTDEAGIYAYSLPAVNAGASITIKVEKAGFGPFEKIMTASQNVVTFVPGQVSVLLIASEKASAEKVVQVQNNTAIPLMVSGVKASADFAGMVSFRFADQYAGRALENGVDFNIDFTASLTDAGKQVTEPKTIKGSILVAVQNPSQAKEWIAALPVEVRIGFGGEVDDTGCLTLSQAKWSIATGKSGQTLVLGIKNNCTVGGKGIDLQALQAKATRTNSNALGSYSVTTSIENSSTIVLGQNFADLAPSVPSGGDYTISINFTPAGIASGKGEEKIALQAANRTNSGTEKITAQLAVSLVVSDLAQCVTISQQRQMFINTCPFNTGYGSYGNYFSGQQGYGMQGYSGSQGTGPNSPYGTSAYSPYGTSAINPGQYYGYSTLQRPYLGNLQNTYSGTYPNSQYRSPNYDGFNYNQNINPAYAGNTMCGQGEFRVANNCASDVHIDISADPALQASKTSIDLKPNEDAKVQVEAGYMMGRYAIEVRAKVKDSTEAPLLLQTIMAMVQSFGEVNYNCITVDPADKLSITEFIGVPIYGTVYNNCYDLGVRLMDSTQGQSIKIGELPYLGAQYNQSELKAQSQQGAQYSQFGFQQGAIPQLSPLLMVNQIRVLPKVVKPAADNRLVEEMKFQVIPNIAYRTQKNLDLQGSAFRQIGQLRVFLTLGYYRVEEMADLIVYYSTPTGVVMGKQFPIIIEDLFAATEFLDKIGIQGDPKITDDFGRCLDKTVLDFGEFTRAKGQELVLDTSTKVDSLIIIDNAHCGWDDELVLEGTTSGAKDKSNESYSIKIEVIGNGHSLKATIIPKKQPPEAGENLPIEVPLKIARQNTNDGAKTLPAGSVTLKARIKGIAGGAIEQLNACADNGETGNGAYLKYGFDKLLWTWEFDKVGFESGKGWSCDAGTGGKGQGYYCDATQFQIELNKKADLIAKYAKANADVYAVINSGGEAGKTGAAKLYDLSMKKAIVTDDSVIAKTKIGFFLKSDYEFLESEKIDPATEAEIKSFADAMKAVKEVNDPTAVIITNAANPALQKLASGKYANRVIVVLTGMDAYDSTLKELGAEKPELLGSSAKANYYVMTIGEYAKMHGEIVKNPDAAKSVCTIDSPTKAGAKTVINCDFMTAFYKNSKFVVGINDAGSPGIETIRKIVREGEDREGVKAALPDGYGYASFGDFYFDLIDFNAGLKKDNINQGFLADFNREYNKSLIGLEADANGTASIPESASYGVIYDFSFNRNDVLASYGVIYDFGFKNDVLTLTKTAGLSADYAKNQLFGMPFDGKVGFDASGNVSRNGYGTSYGTIASAKQIFLGIPSTEKLSPTETANLLRLANNSAGTNGALVKIDAQYLAPELLGSTDLRSLNEEMRTGLIFSLDSGKLKFGAAKAIPLQLTVKAKTSGAMVAYDMGANEGALNSVGNPFSNDSKWLDWELSCSSIKNNDFKGNSFAKKSDESIQRGSFIADWFKRDYRGFSWQAPTLEGTVALRALAIEPYGQSMTIGNLLATESASMQCANCAGGKASIDSGSANYLTMGDGSTESVLGTQFYSVPQAFELLKGDAGNEGTGKACIVVSGGAMGLNWNKEYYYAKLPKAECAK